MADSVNPPQSSGIFARIQNATDHELRTVLAGLCADETTRKEAVKMFSRLEKTARALEGSNQPSTTVYICLNCKEAYIEAQNAADACYYHSGIVVINYENDEAWVDCDPEQIYDSPDMREENPEGFMWTCCDAAWDTVGCKASLHQQGGAKPVPPSSSLPADERRGSKRAREA